MIRDGGFSQARLARMKDILSASVERGLVPGLVSLVSRRGETHVHAIGRKALDAPEPIRRDTIFRITSMTKPIAAVAAMILVEECRLRLDDPLDPFLPELANRRVLTRFDAPLTDTVPARRPITLRDLLTFQLGWGMGMVADVEAPIVKAVRELGLAGFGPPEQDTPLTGDEYLRRLGTLPLMFQPGERWLYGVGAPILGVLLERVSGQPLESFLWARIFDPLRMVDTGFSVPAGKLSRLAPAYWPNDATGALDLTDGVADSKWNKPPVFADAGAGLVSTVDDYHAFSQMLLGGGRLGDTRILSRVAVELMTTDQLTPTVKAHPSLPPGWDNRGWGFCVMICTGRDQLWSTPGRFGWDGGYGTSWAADPREEMTAILMSQRAGFPLFSPLYNDFWNAAYAAIDD